MGQTEVAEAADRDESSWNERSQVLLEQVESICVRGRGGKLSYMQAVVELEALDIGKHLESKGRQSTLAASRAVIGYQTLLRLLDAGRKLEGWGAKHEDFLSTALDILLYRLSAEEHALFEKKLAQEKADGFVASCADSYYADELTQLVTRFFQGAKLAERPLRAAFAMGIYPCPLGGEHRAHAPSVCMGAEGMDVCSDDVLFMATQLRRFAGELEEQLDTQSVGGHVGHGGDASDAMLPEVTAAAIEPG